MEHYFTNDENLKSDIRKIHYQKDDVSFCFLSDNGVFSKDKIDYGSSFLVDTFLKNKELNIHSLLDVGCGYGFMGIVLSKLLDIEVDMIDINKRALHLALRNIKENEVQGNAFSSNEYENITKKYDGIITNPPIRAGKDVVMSILINAKSHLNKDGELWFVMRKSHGVKSTIKNLEEFYKLEIVEKSKGFYVVRAKSR